MRAIGINDPSNFGRDYDRGDDKSYSRIQEDYRNGLSNLNDMYINGEITQDQLLRGQQELGDLKDSAMSERRKALEYKDEWSEEELEELVEEFGLEEAEEISGIDIDESGTIGETGMSEKDYGRQRQYDRDMESYGDNDGDNIPDYPRDEFGDTAINPDTGEAYGFENGQSIYDADVDTGRALRPGSELKSDFEESWLNAFNDPNVKEWEETAPGVFEPKEYYNSYDVDTGFTYTYDSDTGHTYIDYGGDTGYVGVDKDGDNYADGYDTDGDGIADTFIGTNIRKENDEFPYGRDVQEALDEGREVRIVNEDGSVTDARTGNTLDDPSIQRFDENGDIINKSTGQKYGRGSDGSLQEYSETGLHPREVEMIEDGGWVDNGDGTISRNQNPGTPKVNLEDNTYGQGEIVGYHDYPDTDGDGLTDDIDDFPNDPNEQEDQDGDGIGDNSDPFPLLGPEETVLVNTGKYVDNGDGTVTQKGSNH